MTRKIPICENLIIEAHTSTLICKKSGKECTRCKYTDFKKLNNPEFCPRCLEEYDEEFRLKLDVLVFGTYSETCYGKGYSEIDECQYAHAYELVEGFEIVVPVRIYCPECNYEIKLWKKEED